MPKKATKSPIQRKNLHAALKELEEEKDVVEPQKQEEEPDIFELLRKALNRKGKDGLPGSKGDPGNDYILTDADKQEIAAFIDVPVVEKIIEKTEVIKEQPVVTEVVREIAVADSADVIAQKLNTLEEVVDMKVIKGFRKILGDLMRSAMTNYDARHTYRAGSGIAISPSNVISTAAGGASSGYQQPTSGSITGSNTIFVWATAPNVIVVDGVPKQKTSSDTTVNWTGTTTTTLSVAPTFDIYATA